MSLLCHFKISLLILQFIIEFHETIFCPKNKLIKAEATQKKYKTKPINKTLTPLEGGGLCQEPMTSSYKDSSHQVLKNATNSGKHEKF